jgi:hypothetical protein
MFWGISCYIQNCDIKASGILLLYLYYYIYYFYFAYAFKKKKINKYKDIYRGLPEIEVRTYIL